MAATQPESGPTGTLAIRRAGGGGGVPYVMLHGFGGDSLTWGLVEPLLPADRPIAAIDLPCHGNSPRLPVGDFAELVEMVAPAFLAAHEVPVDLVGHSLGGALALALADQFPYRVRSLTLIAPAGLGPEMNPAIVRSLVDAGDAKALGDSLRQLVGDPSLIDDAFEAMAWAMRADPDLRAAQKAMAAALFPDGEQAVDLRGALERVSCPVRLIWGRSDAVVPVQHALRVPGSVSVTLFDETGHLPHIERAQAVARLLGD